MLGKYIRVRVTHPIHAQDPQRGVCYPLNFGVAEGGKQFTRNIRGVYIMGISHPVRSFDGRVIAILRRPDEGDLLIAAPRKAKFIDPQIRAALAPTEGADGYTLECLYERSCGAIVYRIINDELRFLLIRNKRSTYWGFPKGHMERDETKEDTARREVLEETGLHITIIPHFSAKSEYTIQGKVEKAVTIFLASTEDTQTVIQQEEIDDYVWYNYDKAYQVLKFDNDRQIIKRAYEFIQKHHLTGGNLHG